MSGFEDLPIRELEERYNRLVFEVLDHMSEYGVYLDDHVVALSGLGQVLEERGRTKSLIPIPDGEGPNGNPRFRFVEFPTKLEEEHFEYICRAVKRNPNGH